MDLPHHDFAKKEKKKKTQLEFDEISSFKKGNILLKLDCSKKLGRI